MPQNQTPVLLTTAYLPPVQYLSKFLLNRKVLLEKHENYQKQSYRNRCYIYGANGRLALVVPVIKPKENAFGITNVRIDYEKKWQRIHWKSIESAYRLSPYFEFYADGLAGLFEKRIDKLFDWNLAVLKFILNTLNICTSIGFTESYETPDNRPYDYRQCIHPKKCLNKSDPSFKVIPYQQVFAERSGFLRNMSIIDLIFNEGPQALDVIRASVLNNSI